MKNEEKFAVMTIKINKDSEEGTVNCHVDMWEMGNRCNDLLKLV